MKDKELFEILEKHILEDKNPSEFLNYLKEKKLLEGSFLEILRDLEEVKQEKNTTQKEMYGFIPCKF
ncbi:hypothetical protein LZD60_07670 [Clostridium perfringens]|nr:hypothetical protein LZD60_07670 [Clostridium perfringens]